MDKTAVGLSAVDNTSDATKNSASVTLTNKTISGASNTLTNIAQSSVTNLTTDLAGKQPLDGDLTALSGLSGTNTIYYRSGVDTWSAVTIGSNLTFNAGVLSASAGSSVNTGTVDIDFGSGLGSNEAEVVITGQAGITSTSLLNVRFELVATTDHTVNDTQYVASLCGLTVGNIVNGTGFTIYGRSVHKLSGKFKVRWTWQ